MTALWLRPPDAPDFWTATLRLSLESSVSYHVNDAMRYVLGDALLFGKGMLHVA